MPSPKLKIGTKVYFQYPIDDSYFKQSEARLERRRLIGKITAYCKGGKYMVQIDVPDDTEDEDRYLYLAYENRVRLEDKDILAYGKAAEAIYG